MYKLTKKYVLQKFYRKSKEHTYYELVGLRFMAFDCTYSNFSYQKITIWL